MKAPEGCSLYAIVFGRFLLVLILLSLCAIAADMTDIIKRRILGLDGRRQSFVKSMCDQAGRGIAGGHFLGKSGDSVSMKTCPLNDGWDRV